jgi:polysaccharide export outer membrane protein
MKKNLLFLAVFTLLIAAPASLPAQETDQVPAPWTIGNGDVLRISVYNEETLDSEVVVRPDGRISFPLVNDLEVFGLTVDEVRNRLTTRIGEMITDPDVTVVVVEVNSFRVFVLGEVNTQGALTFARPTRVLEAIAEAGGLTEFSVKKMSILREQADGTQRAMTVDYKKIIQGDLTRNVCLQPGDTLIVY